MNSTDAEGNLTRASAAWMAANKHIGARCRSEGVALVKCKEENPNPEKCLEKEHQATQCLLLLLTDIQQRCNNEFDSYARCLHHHRNELEFCRKEQAKFENACPL